MKTQKESRGISLLFFQFGSVVNAKPLPFYPRK
jgi:hypothetical protein